MDKVYINFVNLTLDLQMYCVFEEYDVYYLEKSVGKNLRVNEIHFKLDFDVYSDRSWNMDTLDIDAPDLTSTCRVPGRKKMLRTCWGKVTSRNCRLDRKG